MYKPCSTTALYSWYYLCHKSRFYVGLVVAVHIKVYPNLSLQFIVLEGVFWGQESLRKE